MSELLKISVEYWVKEDQVKRLEKLLPGWREYTDADGGRPFANWTVENLLKVIMESGSYHDINKKIDFEEYRQSTVQTTSPPAATGQARKHN